jgi:hypothetical protein
MSSFVLFSYGAPDLMMAGAAIFAMLCGVVLMGGRLVVGRPLRMLLNLRSRGLRHEPVACVAIPRSDRMHEQNGPGVERPLQRAA